ncbi:MAG TPA: YggS family pyridoxal phosphate-dependent enzyme, partial [bacterium]
MDRDQIETALAHLRDRIASAAVRSGRHPEDIVLVAVTKGVDADRIRAAIAAGITDLGENRVQEAALKIEAIGRRAVHWHLVGHLQRNKVREAVGLFDVIHSVDRVRLAADLSRLASMPIEILLQVNVSGERQKSGFSPDDLPSAIRQIAALPGLNVTGLMTIAPMMDDPETVRPIFRRLRDLRDRLNALGIPGLQLRYLSMGMSDDFEVAVEEGATIVRIGRA